MKLAELKEKAGQPYPDMVKYGEGIWHCIHPTFLADQLTLSLDRLELSTLDVCLLHNPEYFLSDAAHHAVQDLASLRTNFYERLRAAFTYFETQVAAGRLQYYGVSSNTVTSPADHPEATSLSQMLEAASAAARATGSESHHFRILQCPMNLFESGAGMTANTGPNRQYTVLQYGQENGVAVLVNRPLNAMPTGGGSVLRLAELPLEGEPVNVNEQDSQP